MMDGVVALPAFPVVLVTIDRNIITVALFTSTPSTRPA